MKIGVIARADNTGLGIESWEFCRHFPDAKVLIVQFPQYPIYPERFREDYWIVRERPEERTLKDFLVGLDLVICFETPYNWNLFNLAREMKVKSVLRVNYEWLPREISAEPDLYISPSLWNFDRIPDPKVYLPFPINREVLPFKLRTTAERFLHVAGNGKAGYDRNGTEIFIKAIPLVKADVKFIIRCQKLHYTWDFSGLEKKRVKIIIEDAKNYWEVWEEADVYVSPRKYAGQSLPLNEAMSLGLPAIMTDMKPQNEFLNPELLIPVKDMGKFSIHREIDYAVNIAPEDLAKKIDDLAFKNIEKYSKISDHRAEAWSWETLLPKYKELFKNLCRQTPIT